MNRPYVISWNLTYRCNLACEHCYLDAGAAAKVDGPNFSDRSELSTDECKEVVDQIADFAPECLTILTGGEPLLRRDIMEIVRYAVAKKLWVVIGTNGVKVTEKLAALLKDEGVRGLSLSLDGLSAEVHDRFRMVKGAWENTVNGAKILKSVGLPFIIQTTVGKHNHSELEGIADFAQQELGATVWNVYFLVQTGRGQFVSDISADEYEEVLAQVGRLQKRYQDRMMINAKCAPHYVRKLFEEEPDSPFLKSFTGGAGGCPAGTHYMGIRPNGDMTPCPYLPTFAGNIRRSSLKMLWQDSELFNNIRARNNLGGNCGSCEFKSLCGGCRARAYGMSGDYMAADPLCNYETGKFDVERLNFSASTNYGHSVESELAWEPDAQARINRIPAFVRGKVVKSVEAHCREHNLQTVSISALEAVRAKMPTPKFFSRPS